MVSKLSAVLAHDMDPRYGLGAQTPTSNSKPGGGGFVGPGGENPSWVKTFPHPEKPTEVEARRPSNEWSAGSKKIPGLSEGAKLRLVPARNISGGVAISTGSMRGLLPKFGGGGGIAGNYLKIRTMPNRQASRMPDTPVGIPSGMPANEKSVYQAIQEGYTSPDSLGVATGLTNEEIGRAFHWLLSKGYIKA